MTDMLVRLYQLPGRDRPVQDLEAAGIIIRPARAFEKHAVVPWVAETFSRAWASECEAAFCRQPVSCYIATEAGTIIGFACYDATCRNFFGPLGVAADKRGKRVGHALLLCCLHAMAAAGYAYAVVGGVTDTDYYAKAVNAFPIPGSSPGIYTDRL